jgi:hypothetical protein
MRVVVVFVFSFPGFFNLVDLIRRAQLPIP